MCGGRWAPTVLVCVWIGVGRVFNVGCEFKNPNWSNCSPYSAAPYWHDMPPANTNTSEGENVVFDCKTIGNPTPVVTFYKNGVGELAHFWHPTTTFTTTNHCSSFQR